MSSPAAGRTDAAASAGFTEGSVGRHLWRLGSYMAVGSVSINLAQLAEAAFLGMLGTQALAAMGFAFPVTITLFAFAGGIGAGASSVIARAMGSGDRTRSARLVSHAQLLALTIGLLLAYLGHGLADPIVSSLGATGATRELSIQYLEIYMLGFPAFMLSMVGSSLLRATGNAASPGIIMTFGSVLQILVCPVLIFGWFGLPELGIAGAAWAYVISRSTATLLYLVLLIRVRMFSFSLRRLADSWTSILHVGGPAIASGLIQPISVLFITRLLADHGDAVVAGYNVAMRVETMAHMILWAASSSVEPFIGQNWGAGKVDRVRHALRLGFRFCQSWAAVTFVLMATFGAMIVRHIDPNPTVVEVAWWFFIIIPPSIGFMGALQMASSSFNARGQPGPPLVLSIARTFALYIPLCWICNLYWGYIGIYVATAVTNVLMGVLAWRWNASSIEQTNNLLTGREATARA
ncbi:MAG: MATE family efflux transporter [Pseudomonadota bacterium]